MTFVDDTLPGNVSIRSAKSGSAQKTNDKGTAADQRSAFQSAFADAGKKTQPDANAISAKPSTDPVSYSNATARVPRNTTENETSGSREAPLDPLVADTTGKDEHADPKVFSSDKGNVDRMGIDPDTSSARQRPAGDLPKEDGMPATAEAKPRDRRMPLPAISLLGAGAKAFADAGQTVAGPAGEKVTALLKDGLKDGKSQLAKLGDVRVDKEDADADASVQSDPAAGTGTDPADVSQILSLLAATSDKVAARAPARSDTPVSAFQALAEQAGKTGAGPKDGAKTKSADTMASDATAVENATEAGSSQLFRFARADGKGQAVSMNLASDRDRAEVKNDTPVPNAKAETVTVLEARRYLGLAPTGNAAAITSQIAANPEWTGTLQSSAAAPAVPGEAQTGKVLNTLKIQMHPIDLGMVTATMRLKGDELHVELKVETGDAFRQLSDDQNEMIKALRAQGFAVDQVNVVFNAPDSSASNSGQQPQAGQQGREAAGDGPGQGRGQRNDNGSQQQGRERWTGNEAIGDAPSAGEHRTGDVYM